jgi:hypothetical protein
MPSSAVAKADRERRVFEEFVRKSGLPIDVATIESREPPEPDIRCVHSHDGPIAFELVELCNSELAQDAADQIKHGKKPRFLMLNDPSRQAVEKKLGNSYRRDYPIELLCYTDGLLVTPDDTIVETLKVLVDNRGLGPFRHMWLLGELGCYLLA